MKKNIKIETFDEIVKKHFANLSDEAFDTKLAEWRGLDFGEMLSKPTTPVFVNVLTELTSPNLKSTKNEKNNAVLSFNICLIGICICIFLF